MNNWPKGRDPKTDPPGDEAVVLVCYGGNHDKEDFEKNTGAKWVNFRIWDVVRWASIKTKPGQPTAWWVLPTE